MNKNLGFQRLIYLIIILTLNFACANQGTSNSHTIEAEKANPNSNDEANSKLKYTSGIHSIFHDSKGNYWFGSHQEGVCFFDGESFTYFTVEDGLSGNQVRSIQEEENGTIWFETGNGVSSYDGNRIVNRTPKDLSLGFELSREQSWSIKEGDLWFGAGNKSGVYRFNGQELNYLTFPVKKDASSFNPYVTTGFAKGKRGYLWITTYAAAFGFDGTFFEKIDDKIWDSKDKKTLHIRSIFEDSKGRLWIGNNGIGILLKEGNSIIDFSKENGLVPISSSRNGSPSPTGSLEHVFAIAESSTGNIWFGDRDTGAWKYDGKTMTNYTKKDGLTSNFVQVIYRDNNDKLWFGLSDGSLYQFNGKSFERVF